MLLQNCSVSLSSFQSYIVKMAYFNTDVKHPAHFAVIMYVTGWSGVKDGDKVKKLDFSSF